MRSYLALAVAVLGLCFTSSAVRATPIILSDGSGLAAEVEFTVLDATTLQVRVRNISPDVPESFAGAAQLLTVVSWDFGLPGNHASDPAIIGGSAVIGPSSHTVNFDTGFYGPGTNVGGEWGYSNTDISGSLMNGFGANTAGTTPFGGPNLDGPAVLNGPQAGLITNPVQVSPGGIGAIQDEVIVTLLLSKPIKDLDDVISNGLRVEYGSDAAFITVPEPVTLCLLALGAMLHMGRRKASHS